MKKPIISILVSLCIVGAAIAADTMQSGADNVTNTMEGQIVYARMLSYDGTYWDRTRTPMSDYSVFDDDAASNCVAITASSVQFTLPTASDIFMLCASGNTAYLLCGANPTATTTVTTGFSMFVPEGSCIGPLTIASAKCAVIGTSAAGSLCFMQFTKP